MEIGIVSSRNNKIKIYADGEYMFTVPAALWYSSRFHEGDDVSEAELSELKNQGEQSLAFDSAMRMLSLRAHSESELRHKLSQKFPVEAVSHAIEKLNSLGLLDDEKFALLFTEELYRRKGYAKKRIIIELKNRGIDSQIAENAINSLDIDTEIGIIKVIEKYKINEQSSPKEKDRVIRRLLNMGYSFSDISRHINIYGQD